MVTIMWVNEMFDPNQPDTYFGGIAHGKLKLMTIVGTRPEIIRLSSTIKACDQYFNQILVHTGQNYDYTLNQIFF